LFLLGGVQDRLGHSGSIVSVVPQLSPSSSAFLPVSQAESHLVDLLWGVLTVLQTPQLLPSRGSLALVLSSISCETGLTLADASLGGYSYF
jgi:hypothetical protein